MNKHTSGFISWIKFALLHLEYKNIKVSTKDLRFDTQIKDLFEDYLVLKVIMIC